jgi:hypothetical protein
VTNLSSSILWLYYMSLRLYALAHFSLSLMRVYNPNEPCHSSSPVILSAAKNDRAAQGGIADSECAAFWNDERCMRWYMKNFPEKRMVM